MNHDGPPCPLCRTSSPAVVRVGVREEPSEPVFGCSRCGLQYLRSPDYDIRRYYAEEYRRTHSYAPGTVLSPEEEFQMMRPLMETRAMLFRERVPAGSIVLEVGCSSGFFLDAIRDSYSVYGNEWNPDNARHVRELGIPCSEDDLTDAFPGQKFTAICAFHVLEHMPDPVGWLKVIKGRLIGGGWVYLEVPNLESALVSVYDIPEFRDRWYRKPHLLYFNMQNLASLLGGLGFEARVTLTEPYSLGNHLRWLLRHEPDPDAKAAQRIFMPAPKGHPAAVIVNRWFARVDREYRGLLDTLKASANLLAVGRKREI